MWHLYHKLWIDEVGSATAEMGLVTAVTVGALFMAIGDFAATVNQEFETAVQSTSLMTIEEQQKEEEEKDEKEEEREKRRIKRFRRAEDNVDNDPHQ